MATPGGGQVVRPASPANTCKYSMMFFVSLDETKLFHFHRIFKINETNPQSETNIYYTYEPLSRNP